MKKIFVLVCAAVFLAASLAHAQEKAPATEGGKDTGAAAASPKVTKEKEKGKGREAAPAKKKADEKKTEEAAPAKKEEPADAKKKGEELRKAPEPPPPAAAEAKGPPVVAPKSGKSGDELIEDGVAFFKSGRYPESADALSDAVRQLPNYPRASLLLANSLFAVGNFETAAGELARGLELARVVDKELKEIREVWRDYVLLKQRIDGLGRLVEANRDDTTLRLLYGFYYGIAGYREYANKVLRSIPPDSDDGPAVSVLLSSKLPKKPWIDLPPPAYQPAMGRRAPRVPPYPPPPPPPPPDVTRHLNIGFGFGGNILNGQLQSGTRSQTAGYGSGRFFIGFLVEKLEVDFNFGWQSLRGDLMLPSFYGRDLNINLYSMGLEVAWHILQGNKRARGFDPSVRVGYAFHEMEADNSYYYNDYYGDYYSTTAAVGHGPMAGVSLDYVFAFYPLDITLGLDTFYQVLILQDDAGAPLDGGSLNIQGKVGFRF